MDLSAVPSAPPAACGADTVGRLGEAVKTRKKTGKNREKMGGKWARYGLKRVLRSMRERRRGEPEPERQPRRVSAPPRRPDLSWRLPKIPSKTAKFHPQIVENRVECQPQISPVVAAVAAAHLYFVLDFCQGGELFFHLRQRGTFPETWCRFYAAQVRLETFYGNV